MWFINDDGATPPLPGEVPRQSEVRRDSESPPLLKHGCWITQLDPIFADDFDAEMRPDAIPNGWTISYGGTLRVERTEGSPLRPGTYMRVSGDFYVMRQSWTEREPATPPSLPRPSNIPVFPRQDYAFYITVQDYANECGEPVITLACHRFDHAESTWGPAEILFARPIPAKERRTPSIWRDAKPGRYLCWLISNDRGTVVGRLHMGWIAPDLRAARIEVAVAAGIEPPLGHEEHTLKGVFRNLGWKIRVGRPVIAQGPPDVWPESELHARMLELRSSANLDREWLYHVLVVPRFRKREVNGFGRLYDRGALDTNMVPREGLVVAATARFPRIEQFGAAAGQRLIDVPAAAFHNLVHELGHTMGLVHRFRGAGFMQALDNIAQQASPQNPFPSNLRFEFDPLDALRLCHYPDMWVRPGGVPFGQGFSALPIPDSHAITDVSGQFDLLARPLRVTVPLGAPVKLQLRLTNKSERSLPGPSTLSLSDGSIFGRVIGPGNQVHPFSSASPLDYIETQELPAGQSLFHGESLWRGPQGALFPAPGFYRIEVEAGWVGPGGIAQVSTRCEVLITAPHNGRHELAAFNLLQSDDVAVLLVFRALASEPASHREKLEEAIRILHEALAVRELRRSLAPIEARRLVDTELLSAARLIEQKSLMTSSEVEHLLEAVSKANRTLQAAPEVRRMVAICRAKARRAVRKQLAPQSLLDLATRLERQREYG